MWARHGPRRGDEPKVELVTFVPMIACLYAIYKNGTKAAFLYVVLPTLLLVPTYYYFILKPFPAVNFINAALIPLGVGMLLFDSPRWRVSRTDILVLVFVFTSGYAALRFGKSTDAVLNWVEAVITAIVPYMAGKLLIEQTGNRIKVSRMFILLVAAGSIVSSYEYLFKRNPYVAFWGHFYPSEYAGWSTQIRWGFGRVAGPFSQSELAGAIVGTAWLMALWLGRTDYPDNSMRRSPVQLKEAKWVIWGLFLAMFMTQARGPWIGALLGLAVAGIGRAKRPGRRAAIVIFLMLGVGIPVYTLGKGYLSGPRKNYGSEKETAQYRAELVSNYIPLAERGGLWGYGIDFPRIGGQDSIDNDYLLTWLTQGSVGAIALILLLVESAGKLTLHIVRARTRRDRHFYLTMAGILLALAFTISTVYLGAQTYELLFLLIGWIQGMHTPRVTIQVVENEEFYRRANEREMVYS